MDKKKTIWGDTSDIKKTYPSLYHDMDTDIVIIGAGITGLTTAYLLAKAGKPVIVIEANTVGSGTTGYSSANLYLPTQTPYHVLKRKHGYERVRQISNSREAAIDLIENITGEYNIPCHFIRRPFYMYTDCKSQNASLEKELKLFDRIGIDAEYTRDFPLSVPFQKAIRIPHQARFNPLVYTQHLARVLISRGCEIFENTRVRSLEKQSKNIIITTASGKKVTTRKIIIATHLPIGIHYTQFLDYPYRSYVLAVTLKNKIYPNGNFWKVGEPHLAISTHNIFSDQLDYLLIAGNHHKTGETSSQFTLLEKYLNAHFQYENIDYRWSAQHYQPADGLPYIGGSGNIYLATGFSADGLTYGTVAGMLLSDLLLGKQTRWKDLYNPSRFTPLASGIKFLKENTKVFCEYLSDLPKKTFNKINTGEGKVIQINNEKCAAYRDEQQTLHLVSAVCTHMKCIVNWNPAEKSWDCPCHGSRFSIDGDVLEGPATLPLPKREGTLS